MGQKLTVLEAAKMLGVSKRRAHQLVKSGELPVTAANGRFEVDMDDVLAVGRRPAGRPRSEPDAWLDGMPVEFKMVRGLCHVVLRTDLLGVEASEQLGFEWLSTLVGGGGGELTDVDFVAPAGEPFVEMEKEVTK